MTRKVLCAGAQLAATVGTIYTVPPNSTTTISAFTLNGTTGTARLVTIHLVQSGGPSAANQIATTITVPAVGAMPTIVAGLIGQSIGAGGTIQAFADAASAVTVYASGYEAAP